MARDMEFHENHLTVRLTGGTSLAALKSKLDIPYASIKEVSVKPVSLPLLTFRIGTSGFGIREGRFYFDNGWHFVSFTNNENALIIELTDDQEYKSVILGLEHAEQLKDLITQRCSQMGQ